MSTFYTEFTGSMKLKLKNKDRQVQLSQINANVFSARARDGHYSFSYEMSCGLEYLVSEE